MPSDIRDYRAAIVKESEKAWLFQFDNDDKSEHWVPKSVGELNTEDSTVALPDWFVEKNELDIDPVVTPAFRR